MAIVGKIKMETTRAPFFQEFRVMDAQDWFRQMLQGQHPMSHLLQEAVRITFTEDGSGIEQVLKDRNQEPTFPVSKDLLILTVGLPRSGKSTWAKDQGFPIVNPDAIRLAMHGMRFAAQAEPWVWVTAFTMAEALLLSGHKTIIVDATNVSKRRRDEWAKKFPKCVIRLQVFGTSPEECKRRALASGQEDLIGVIDRMAEAWDLEKPECWNEESQP